MSRQGDSLVVDRDRAGLRTLEFAEKTFAGRVKGEGRIEKEEYFYAVESTPTHLKRSCRHPSLSCGRTQIYIFCIVISLFMWPSDRGEVDPAAW